MPRDDDFDSSAAVVLSDADLDASMATGTTAYVRSGLGVGSRLSSCMTAEANTTSPIANVRVVDWCPLGSGSCKSWDTTLEDPEAHAAYKCDDAFVLHQQQQQSEEWVMDALVP